MKRRIRYSYKTHYWCPYCRWVEKDSCIAKGQGYWCPTCNRRVRTRAKCKYSSAKWREKRAARLSQDG